MRDRNDAAYRFWGDEWTHYSLTRCLYETTNGGGGHMVGPEELAVETGVLPIHRARIGSLHLSSRWFFEDSRTYPAFIQISSL